MEHGQFTSRYTNLFCLSTNLRLFSNTGQSRVSSMSTAKSLHSYITVGKPALRKSLYTKQKSMCVSSCMLLKIRLGK